MEKIPTIPPLKDSLSNEKTNCSSGSNAAISPNIQYHKFNRDRDIKKSSLMEEVLSVSPSCTGDTSFFANEFINKNHKFWNKAEDLNTLLTSKEKRYLDLDSELDGDYYDLFMEDDKDSFLKAV